jgi:hypothetical protein
MKTKKSFKVFALSLQGILTYGQKKDITYPYTWATTQNPIAKQIYACDPSAKVYSNGTIRVFASHDPGIHLLFNSLYLKF